MAAEKQVLQLKAYQLEGGDVAEAARSLLPCAASIDALGAACAAVGGACEHEHVLEPVLVALVARALVLHGLVQLAPAHEHAAGATRFQRAAAGAADDGGHAAAAVAAVVSAALA